jgi:T5SS/PEP-CTERM-associated repeat protein
VISKNRTSWRIFCVVALAMAAVHGEASAQTTNWIAGVSGWNFAGNWDSGVPTDATRALINNGGTARVFASGAVANYLGLGEDEGGQGSLEIAGGALQVNFIRAGLSGSGTFAIHDGGTLTSRFGVLGGIEDGTAEVSGSNSTWTTTGSDTESGLDIGIFGFGFLYIQDGGTVSSTYVAGPVVLGNYASANGTIAVDGANSKFTNSADLYLGNNGVGSLYVGNGGKAINFNGDLAVNSGSFGTAGVDGPGSVWTNNSVLAVGVSGTAMLSITGGGSVVSTNGRIGREVGSNGIATVDGAGSNWTASGDLSIANAGIGALNILNGAKVSNFNGNIGVLSGSNGVVTVSGPGSWWQNNSVVAVGIAGAGQLHIRDGAVVSNTNGRIGREAGSDGVVTVDGAQSWWANTGALTIGLAGTGTASLSVTNGGIVSAAGGMSIGPLGTVMGDGSIYADVTNAGVVAPGTSPGTLYINNNYIQSATGTLQIELASGTSFDKLQVSGDITFGGTLDVSLVGGYVPRGTYAFDILDWISAHPGSHNGIFSAIQLPTADGTLSWDTSQLYTTGVLSVTGTGSPDDFNGNGIVDAADYTVWRDGLGSIYNQADYEVWKAHFGETIGSGADASTASLTTTVPEPATATLFVLGFAIAGAINRRNTLLRKDVGRRVCR